MGISPSAKQFLKDNKNLINKSGFKILYDNENLSKWNVDPILISEISQIFLNSGINPLNYLDRVPRYFLYGAEILSIEIPNNIKKIEYNAFFDSDLINVEIPDSVTEIGGYVFYIYSKLKSISFPNTLKIIPENICFGCKLLETINIPDGIEKIENSAFNICPSLQDIILPKTLIRIENNAFSDHLKEIKFRGTKEQWKEIDIDIKNPFFKPLNPTIIHCIDGDIMSKNLKWVEVD